MNIIELTLPIRTVNESNTRGGWQARSRRTKAARHTAHMALSLPLLAVRQQLAQLAIARVSITLTRISPGKTDTDGTVSALKATRDGVADALGVDDGSPLLVWSYGQRKGKPREYGVVVRIETEEQGG